MNEQFVPRGGDIGEEQEEREYEPIEVPATEPAEPVKVPESDPIPA